MLRYVATGPVGGGGSSLGCLVGSLHGLRRGSQWTCAVAQDGSGCYDLAHGHCFSFVGSHEAKAHEELGKHSSAVEAAEILMARFP